MGFLFKQMIKNVLTNDKMLGGIRVQSSTQGLPVTLCYGMARVTPNLGWYGDFTAIPHTTTETSGGGKGGGGGGKTTITRTYYTYQSAVVVLVSEGQISGYGTVWKDKDKTTTGVLGFSEFLGTSTQNTWAYMTTHHPSEAIAYRNQSYIANGTLDLGGSDTLPNLSMEVKGILYGNVYRPDANPSAVLRDMLTSVSHGALFPGSALDTLFEMQAYCDAQGIFVSPVYASQQSMTDIILEMAHLANCAPVWSGGKLKFIPYADQPVYSAINLNNNMPSIAGFAVAVNPAPVSISKTLALDTTVTASAGSAA